MSNKIKIMYEKALESIIEKMKKDKYVIGVLLAGSLSYDVVWEKSDIDLIVIVEDAKKPYKFHSFTENNIIINASIYNRHKFKRLFESQLSSSRFHSFISKATLLFSKDESLEEYYNNMINVSENDNNMILVLYGAMAVAHLAKAQKWLQIKDDYMYSYYEITHLIRILADIEVVLNNEIPTREAIHRALEYNDNFFSKLYFDLAQEEKNPKNISKAIELIQKYLEERTCKLFNPILELLSDYGELIGATELHERLSKKMDIDKALLIEAFEWLVEKEKIQKSSLPVRITTKSRIQVEEVAYCI